MDHKDKIIGFYQKHGRLPGYKEMMSMLGFKSKNAVFKLINKLVDEGILNKDSNGRISLNSIFDEIPLLGLVEAGIPETAEEIRGDTISLEDFLVENKDSTYLLEVKGDSMIDAHIEEGDMVLVDRKGKPKEGDIVIAEVDGGWTMKYLRRDSRTGKHYLQPANKNYRNIYPEYEMKIAAIVRAVIRKY
ncbi:MAG TPA: S24 family peptidase [Candidatus Paceibacterota bacterium]|nr:S24 family peptidase [Candidatus Paceibacterota bacterium]